MCTLSSILNLSATCPRSKSMTEASLAKTKEGAKVVLDHVANAGEPKSNEELAKSGRDAIFHAPYFACEAEQLG